MSRHLVTGAAGFIGSNLVARLKAQGEWVRAVDVKTTASREHLYYQADEYSLVADLRHSDEATKRVQDITHVWHFAADHGGAGYFHGPQDFKAAENNLLIDQNVRRAAISTGADRLFFASSACTYPVALQGRDARALKESDWGGGPAEASYGEAKRMSTIMFEAARQHGHDFRSGLFHTIFGPTQDFKEPRAKFPTALCRKVIENPDRVEVWGDGSQVRTFLYIDDAVDRILKVMDKPYQGPVNIGSDEDVTVQECAQYVADAAGVSPEWVYTDGPVGVAHRSSDNTVFDRRYGRGELVTARGGFTAVYEWLDGVLSSQLQKAA